MASLNPAAVFTPGETVNIYNLQKSGDYAGAPVLQAIVADSSGRISAVGLTGKREYVSVGQSSSKRAKAFAVDVVDPDGPAIEICPQKSYGMNATAMVANRAYFTRYRPTADGVVTGINVQVAVAATADDPIDVGIYEMSGDGAVLLASSGPWTGRLIATVAGVSGAVRKHPVPITPTPVFKSKSYLLAVAQGPIGAAAATIICNVPSNAVYFESSQSWGTLGVTDSIIKDASYPLPATIVPPINIITTAPLVGAFLSRRAVLFGDSILTVQSGLDNLAMRLQTRLGRYWHPISAGLAGDTTPLLLARMAADMTAMKPQEVLVHIGVNDLNGGVSAATIEANLVTIANAIKAVGARPIIDCVIPCGLIVGWTGAKETERVALNNWIKSAASPFAAYTDLDAALGDFGPNPPVLKAAYDDGSGVHPNTAGLNAMAAEVFRQAYASTPTPRPS